MSDELDQRSAELDEMGPIDYIVVEFPGSKMTGEGFPTFSTSSTGASSASSTSSSSPRTSTGRSRGSRSRTSTATVSSISRRSRVRLPGLLGEDDIEEAGTVLEPGSSAGILVYENVWAGPFAAAVRRGGGQLVASGRIPIQAMLAALEAAEAADAV